MDKITKFSATEISIKKTIPEKEVEQVVSLSLLKRQRHIQLAEVQSEQAKLDEMDAQIAKATELGVVERVINNAQQNENV